MQTTAQSRLNESVGDSGFSTSQTFSHAKENPTGNPSSVTAESPQPNRKTISQGKSPSCGKNSPTQKSSKTSEADSTTNEKDSKPYYDDFCKAINLQLLSLTEIASAVLDSTSSTFSSNRTEVKSWFSISPMFHHNGNSQKTCFQSFMSSHAGSTVSEDTKVRSRKIRIYPTQEQKHLFRQWFGVSRKFYNAAVEYYNSEDKSTTRWLDVANIIFDSLTEDYIRIVPYQIKKIAVKDCYNAYRNGCRKAKQTGEGFELSFRTRKGPKQSCYIPKQALSDKGIYHTISGTLKMKERHLLENGWQDLRLVCEHGRWYLSVPVIMDGINPTDNQGREDVVALDPGIRTFITYFSEEGHFGKIGEGAFQKILRLNHKIAKLTSMKDTSEDRLKKRRLYRRIGRLRLKLHDLTDELHWKTADYLTMRFKVILLPTFNTSDMVRKGGRKINKEVVKSMQSFRFYEFSERLKQKCEERGVILIRCNEAYTSKTNSFTGEVMNIGGKKWFTCDGIKVDRDVNGARGILLKAMRDSSATAEMPCVD